MIHPAIRRLVSRRGPVCFGDFSSGQPTPKSYGDILSDKTVRAVLNFVDRFAPPERPYRTIEQVAADHTLFGETLDREEQLLERAHDAIETARQSEGALSSGNDSIQSIAIRNAEMSEAAKAALRDFRAQRDWVAAAIITFKRFGYDGLADPDRIPDSERYKSQY